MKEKTVQEQYRENLKIGDEIYSISNFKINKHVVTSLQLRKNIGATARHSGITVRSIGVDYEDPYPYSTCEWKQSEPRMGKYMLDLDFAENKLKEYKEQRIKELEWEIKRLKK